MGALVQLAGWRVDVVQDVTVIRCEALLQLPGLGHAFSTRNGQGTGEFDLGTHAKPDGTMRERRRALCAAAGLTGQQPVSVCQVHGARVTRATRAMSTDGPTEADGVVALREDPRTAAPAVRWADCVPLLLADQQSRGVAAVHAGWRGTACGVVDRAVAALGELGLRPARLIAALGPAIGPCCYEVDRDVVSAVARAAGARADKLSTPSGARHRLDLRAAIRLQLERAGLRTAAIHACPWCTACSGELFFSHRRSGGETGRQMACIGWSAANRPIGGPA